MPDFTITTPQGEFTITAPSADVAYAAFRKAYGASKPADVESGDEARAKAAGDTRAKMPMKDIEYAYDTAAARGDRDESKAMARAYVKRERQDNPITSVIGDTARAVARGVPVIGGLLDEGNAATSALFGGDYQKSLDYQRAKDATYDEEHPVLSPMLQVGGGVGSGVGIASKVAPMLWNVARPVALGTGAVGGGALGAADGFTRGEDGVDNRLGSAAIGGAIGGAVGAAAPLIGKGIQKGFNAASDYIVRGRGLANIGMSRPSGEVLTRAMEADGTLGGRGAANIGAAGPDAMVADAGPNSTKLLDAVIARGGPGANTARQALEGRVERAGANVRDALDNSLGAPQGVQSQTTGLRQGSAPARANAYDTAYAVPIDYADPAARDLEDLLKRVPQSAISRANTLMKLEGVKSKQIMAEIAPDGSVTFKTMPDVRQLDYMTRALNDVAQAGDGQGALGGFTAEGRAYGNLSRDIRQTLRTLVPEYGVALDTAAEPIAGRRALEFGASLLRPGTTRDAVDETMRGMSVAERELVRRGIRANIDEVMANVKRSMTDPNVDARAAVQAIKEMSSRANREKMAAALGQQEADRLFQRIDEAASAFNLQAGVADNSKTFPRQAMDEVVKREAEPGIVGTLAEGSPVIAGKKLVQSALGTGPANRTAIEDRIYDEIARALTERRGPDAIRLMQELADIQRRSGTAGRAATSAGTLAGGATGGAAYTGGSLLFNRQNP